MSLQKSLQEPQPRIFQGQSLPKVLKGLVALLLDLVLLLCLDS
jgi:hypothetical protein